MEKKECKTRHDFLCDLLKSVFGNKGANYEEDDGLYRIVTKSGIADVKNYKSSACERCRRLFELALCELDTEFEISKKFDIDRSGVLKNCAEYFEKHGVNIWNFYAKQKDNHVLARVLYIVIFECLLPVIYQDSAVSKDDDIEVQMSSAFNVAESMFRSFESGHYVINNIRKNQLMRVYDSSCEQKTMNFAVPISSFEINNIAIPWNIPQIEIKIPCAPRVNSFQNLTKEYLHYPFDDNQVYVKSSGYLVVDESHAVNDIFSYPISNVAIVPAPVSVDFCYITYLDPNSYEIKHRIKTPEQLHEVLIKKAKLDLKRKYKDELRQFYKSVLLSIEDIVEHLLSADLEILIKKDSSNSDACKSLLKHFNVDADDMMKHIALLKCNDEEYISEAFILLEEKICVFFGQLEFYSSSLVREIDYYLSKAEKEEHALKISRYINSSELAKAIRLQHQIKPQYHEELTTECKAGIPVLFCADIAHRTLHDNIYQWFKDTLSQYHEYLVGTCPLEHNAFLHEI